MKRVISKLALLTFVIGIVFVNNSCEATFIKGNGILATSEKSVSEFEKINISGSAEVRFYESDEYRIVLTVDENLEKYVEIFTEGNTLRIKTKNGAYRFTKFLVEVYCPSSLTAVSLSGSGSFKGMDNIITSTFDATISGSGDMRGDVECTNYSAKISGSGSMRGNIVCQNFSSRISGSGEISVTGSSTDADITISGSGDFKGYEFNIKNADINISGSGSANVWVTDNLKAKISGSGNINYKGNPQVNSTISGSGKIKNVN